MKWSKMVAKFDPYGPMINRVNRILIVSRAQLSAMLMASVTNQMLVLSYLAFETLFKFFFCLFYLYTLYMIEYRKHKLSTKRTCCTPSKKLSFYTYTSYLSVLVAELHARREASSVRGGPYLRKSTHARKFGNHVTVHRRKERRSDRATGKPMFTLTLSN